ncbi:hypothetical protein J7T55_008214 [Diaporthe amygdali]|uniref:uncharacterized protein n=1 Tax=Phomopsis amygdali TaxID=1214568 RepID=UPI0022FF31FB|nr:uncharacterized protein J7T55_008214 [Diaporthe amygdali]KAJ0121054.1 hypothetical protein J7T55_008214 [Diaporthe amygdali]
MTKKKPLAKRPTKRGRKRAREIERQENLAKKAIRKENYRNELALLHGVTDGFGLRFCGDIIIQPREDAIQAATQASAAPFDPSHRVFFVSSASIAERAKGKDEGAGQKTNMRSAGAAVVYRRRPAETNQIWQRNLFGLGVSAGNRKIEAGVLAIAECLAIAATEITCAKDQPTPRKVTVFSDCRAAMDRVNRFRRVNRTEKELYGVPVHRKLITASQYLSRHLGVEVELRWVPGHSRVEGNRHAEVAAQKAAAILEIRKGGDSLDKGLQALIERATQSGSKCSETRSTTQFNEHEDPTKPSANPIPHESGSAQAIPPDHQQ